MPTFIYTLSHPDTGEVRYVGKANDLKARLTAHCNPARKRKSHKRAWVQSLLAAGKKPVIGILDEVEISEWPFWEEYWINQLSAWGMRLTNHTTGGEGSTHANAGSFKKGQGSIKIVKVDFTGQEIARYDQIAMAPHSVAHVVDKLGRTSKGSLWFSEEKWLAITQEELSQYLQAADKRFGNNGKATQFQIGNSAANNVSVSQHRLDGELIETFNSIKEAQAKTGIGNIVKAVNGFNKTAGGYIWKKQNS